MGNWISSSPETTGKTSTTPTDEDVSSLEEDFAVIKDFLLKYFKRHNKQQNIIQSIEQLKPLTAETLPRFMEEFKGSIALALHSITSNRSFIDVLEKQCLQKHSEILAVILKDRKREELLKNLEAQERHRTSSHNTYFTPANVNDLVIYLSDGSKHNLKSCLRLFASKIKDNEARLRLEELCYRALQRLKRINDNNNSQVRNYKSV